MKLSVYQRPRSFFDLGHSDFKVKTCLSQEQLGDGEVWNQSSYESLRENGNENLYKLVGSLD